MGTHWVPQHEPRTPPRRKSENLYCSATKRSRRKLVYSLPDETRAISYCSLIGEECVDIISRLKNLPPLDLILSYLDPSSLHAMTKVSASWQEIVYANKSSVKSLKIFRCKRNITKENEVVVPRKARSLEAHPVSSPFHLSNSNSRTQQQFHREDAQSASTRESDEWARCPRCNKSSKVFRLYPNSISNLDCTYPPINTSSTTKVRCSAMLSTSLQDGDNNHRADSFAECISPTCGYKFCTNCLCAHHPGKKCCITELGTPSKILQPESTSPPSRLSGMSKVDRKKSLKRLCF